ncbi:uncharacterized protein LOC132201208 [Neocloeon triangulifer]|uniref:uncharacterized protein LOC132201208 n=1 Tax=Neocloeon triangulifer TaxID=2078957 RepID=UPI00286F4904|nr:uncharacterized protein LOC132201208 [Neocloeon triangulifer]
MTPLLLLTLAATLAKVSGQTCHYEGKTFPAGSDVPTGEKCLSCQCGPQGGAPICRLQVCPELPVPPPKGCVLVHKREECCQKLICEEHVGETALQIERRDGSEDLEAANLTAEDGVGCVVNGTRYAEGSAMSSSTLCEYCYCVRGKQQCVKPRCEMPLEGCTPKYRALTCCPVSYDCSPNQKAVTSTTPVPLRPNGCMVEGSHHKDGMQVRVLAKNCEHCYCLRGVVRCVKLECAPPLLGCEPVFAKGKCCPVQYNCSKIMTEPLYQERSSGNSSIFLQLSDGVRSLNSLNAIDLRKHREMTKNESADSTTMRSTPFVEILRRIESESAEILKNEEILESRRIEDVVTTESPAGDQAESRMDETTEIYETTTSEAPEITTTLMEPAEPFKLEILVRQPDPPSTTAAPTTSTPPPLKTTTAQTVVLSTASPFISDRVDVLDELDETTMELLEMMHKEAAAATSTTTRTTYPPLIEVLLSAKNNEDTTLENEYGEALPPSLPNITMIPFLPEDAVIEKKMSSVDFNANESSTQFGGSGVPVVGAIPPKRFSPPSSLVGGFLPRQPLPTDESSSQTPNEILTSIPQLISITTSVPEFEMDSHTAESIASTTKDVPLASHIRVALNTGPKPCTTPDGRQVKHGDLLASPGPCEVCKCDHGTVLCHEEVECMKLIRGNDIGDMQKRADVNASLPAADTKVAKDEFSLDSVFKFLFDPAPEGAAGAAGAGTATVPPTMTPPPAHRLPRPRPVRPKEPNSIAGMLKLAGCNIYGRMYRVGRIISELSDQCRECKCTELGVECQPLYC